MLAEVRGVHLKREYQRFVGRKTLFLVLLVLGILALSGIAATLGSADISVLDVYSAILAKFFPGYFRIPSSGGCGCTGSSWPSSAEWAWPLPGR